MQMNQEDKSIRERARTIMASAIARGELIRPSICELCKNSSVQTLHGHHTDYAEPLKVTWLCVDCHGLVHRKGTSEKWAVLKISKKNGKLIRELADHFGMRVSDFADCGLQWVLEEVRRSRQSGKIHKSITIRQGER